MRSFFRKLGAFFYDPSYNITILQYERMGFTVGTEQEFHWAIALCQDGACMASRQTH